MNAKPNTGSPMMRRLRGVAKEAISLSILAVLLFAARSSLADHYEVPTGSMEYTLIPGDRIVVDKRAYGLRVPFTNVKLTDNSVARGEVVIFDSPVEDVRLVKRVVAVAGDTVSVRGGRVSINGEYFLEKDNPAIEIFGDRRIQLNLKYGGGTDLSPTYIPEGFVLTIGDSRGNSRDGRVFGMIEEDEIYGKAIAVYYRSADGFMWLQL